MTDLNNPNLVTGIEDAVDNWQAFFGTNTNAYPQFQMQTSSSQNCTVTVKAADLGENTQDTPSNFEFNAQNGSISSAEITLNTSANPPLSEWDTAWATSNVAHEVGHGAGLDDATTQTGCSQTDTVMFSGAVTGQSIACQPTSCDKDKAEEAYPPSGGGDCVDPCLSPTCSNYDPGACGGCQACADVWSCLSCDEQRCICTEFNPTSPILIALGPGADYALMGTREGVWFDINADGTPDRIGWTAPGSLVGFLVLDRNENGFIEHGAELFGTATPLEGSQKAKHGFEALAFFDLPENGGNGDGRIDSGDEIWSKLAVWIDANHNAFSEPGELTRLFDWGITAFDTGASAERRRDRFGNLFYYRGIAYVGNQVRVIYDVFFATRPSRR